MKRLFQVTSVLGLALFLSVAANAQSNFSGEIKFPFAFTFGDRHYDAGTYSVKVERVQSGTAAITLEGRDQKLQTVLASKSGDSPSKEVDLVFDRIGEIRVLSRVVTPNGGFTLNRVANAARYIASTRNKTIGLVVNVNDLF